MKADDRPRLANEAGEMPAADDSVSRERFLLLLALITLVAFAFRIAWLIAQRHEVPLFDGEFYFGLAKALADGEGFLNPHEYVRTGRVVASANHTPAWPLLLAVPHLIGAQSIFAAQVVAALVGTATVAAMGFAGRAMVGPRVGLIAAGVTAAYPNFWVYERELMSETLALLLTAIIVLVAYQYRERADVRSSALLGGLCGLLTLTHPNYLLLVGLLCAPLILRMPQADRGRRVTMFSVAVVAALALIAPWVVYNSLRFDQPVLMTTAFGLTLVDSNCQPTYQGPRLGSWGLLCSLPNPKTDNAADKDAEWRRRGLHFARENVERLPIVIAAREGRTWGLFRPLQQNRFDAEIGSPLWVQRLRLFTYWMLAPCAIAGAVVLRRRGTTLIPVASLFFLVVITVALAFGDTRYRTPAEVAIVLLAATAVDAALKRAHGDASRV